MAAQENFFPSHNEKTLNAMKALSTLLKQIQAILYMSMCPS